MTKRIRSDAWDSGNRLTRFVETWERCAKCGKEYETTNSVFPPPFCPACERESCPNCGSIEKTHCISEALHGYKCDACGDVFIVEGDCTRYVKHSYLLTFDE